MIVHVHQYVRICIKYCAGLQEGMVKVIDNAYRQYIRSRPAAATESIKRAKQLDLSNIGTSVLCLVLYEYTQPCNRLFSSPVYQSSYTSTSTQYHMTVITNGVESCTSEYHPVIACYVGSCGRR